MTTQSQKIAAVLLVFSLLMSGCFKSKVKVFKLKTADVNTLAPDRRAELLREMKKRDGVLYRLPRTVILATVPVKKTSKEPGDFEKFAPCFFSKGEADERTTVKTTEFTLGRIAFDSTGEPDPDETYVVLTRGGFFESKTLLMDYTPDMRLKKGEAESKNEGLEFVSKAVKTGVGIAARAAATAAFTNTPSDPASLAAARFATAVRAKKCYDLIKSYQENYLAEAAVELEKATQELGVADANVLNATTPDQKLLAQQEKAKAEKKKKRDEEKKAAAEKLKKRADEDAAEMANALREESLRARAASSAKAQTGSGGGRSGSGSGSGSSDGGGGGNGTTNPATGGGMTSGTGGAQGSGAPSSQFLNSGSFSNAYGLAQVISDADTSTANASDGKMTLADLAAIMPDARLKQLRADVNAAEEHGKTSPNHGTERDWDKEQARLRGIVTQSLTDALNAALAGPMLYAPGDLSGVDLSAEDLSLIADNPQGERLIQLNRRLLEQALPSYVVARAPSAPGQNFVRHTLVEEFDRAEQTFGLLSDLLTQQDRLRAIGTNVPPDAYKLMLDKTKEGIDDYRESFLGEVGDENWEGVFNFRPKKDMTAQLSPVLFLFSPTKGICTARGLIKEQGVRVSGKFVDADCATHDAAQKDRVAVWLRLDRKSSDDTKLLSSLDLLNNSYDQDNKERGWYFRIPAKGMVVLKTGTLNPSYIDSLSNTAADTVDATEAAAKADEAGRGDLAVAQLGVIASVPASAAGRTTQSSIVLDEATGALLNFKISSDSLLQKTLIDDAKDSADAIIDATDPLKRKKRQADLLDAEKALRDKRKALENLDSNSNSNSGGNNTP